MAFVNFGRNCTVEPCSILKFDWKNPRHGEASHTSSWAGLLQEESGANTAQSSGDLWERVCIVSGKGLRQGPLTRGLEHSVTHAAREEAKQENCHSAKRLYMTRVWLCISLPGWQFHRFSKITWFYSLNHNIPILWGSFIIWSGRTCLSQVSRALTDSPSPLTFIESGSPCSQ